VIGSDYTDTHFIAFISYISGGVPDQTRSLLQILLNFMTYYTNCDLSFFRCGLSCSVFSVNVVEISTSFHVIMSSDFCA
jgi:hypothetical protein